MSENEANVVTKPEEHKSSTDRDLFSGQRESSCKG